MADTFELTGAPPIDKIMALGDVGEFFASFVDLLFDELKKSGIPENDASNMTGQIVCRLSSAFGGDMFYVSKNPVVLAKQLAMYADLKTMNPYDVDKKYRVSKGYSLTIKRKIEALQNHREQLRMEF